MARAPSCSRSTPTATCPAGGWETLAAADAIIFGSPTYMGGASWQFKKFADASSKVWYHAGLEGQALRRLHQQRRA